ncbi:zinc knuckle domain protein [Penicillium canariense]|uniref:Zinc knuckle domain protein n=1 Tax=Penicillium canariense TaxID=189055 RepID=A0A9W9HTM5_9EURO|nr:zinc knuckle domain protein [Penicillium canariense]KAJ5157568.1 zinc knuckle domain protein [Penicillium canariense]
MAVASAPNLPFVHPSRQNFLPPTGPRVQNQHQPNQRETRPTNHAQFESMEEIARAAASILRYIDESAHETTGAVHGFVKQVHRYAQNAQRGDTQGMERVLLALEKISRTTDHLTQRMNTLEKSTGVAAVGRGSSPFAAGPSSWPSSDGTSSIGVPQAELQEDRQIIVKIRDDAVRATLRSKSETDLVLQADRGRIAVARKKDSGALAGIRVVAARKLPSGDIAIITDTAASAEVMRKAQFKDWLKPFGNAIIQRPTWGVVARGLPLFDVTDPAEMNKTADELLRQNPEWSSEGEDEPIILHLSWLTKPTPRKNEGSLVIEMSSPVVANRAIAVGTIWGHRICQTTRFCREGRSKFCRKCQKPGHVQAHCPSKTFLCGYCAAEHPTWECEAIRGAVVTIKCANCKGPHRSTARECEVHEREVARARSSLLEAPPFHRIPARYRQATAQQPAARQPQRQVQPVQPVQSAQKKPPQPRVMIQSDYNTRSRRGQGLEASQHAPAAQQSTQLSQPPTQQLSQSARRGPGRPPGSKNRSKSSTNAAASEVRTDTAIEATETIEAPNPHKRARFNNRGEEDHAMQDTASAALALVGLEDIQAQEEDEDIQAFQRLMRSSVAIPDSPLSSPPQLLLQTAEQDLPPPEDVVTNFPFTPIEGVRYETYVNSWTEEEEEIFHDASSDSDYDPTRQ